MARTMATPGTVYDAKEGDKFNADTTLEVVSCATCHITYAIPASLKSSALKYPGGSSGGWKLCCPLGHTWWYVGRSVEDKLQASRDRAGRLSAQLDQTQASLRAQKGAATRARNQRDRDRSRVAAGVCPCCNRTFQNLARHMAGQHPDFGPVGEHDHAE